MKRCFIYSHYDKDEELKQYALDEVSFLNKNGNVLFVSGNNIRSYFSELNKLENTIYTTCTDQYLGDEYAYSLGLNYLYTTNQIDRYDYVYFINNQIDFPLVDESEFIAEIEKMENNEYLIWGMTKSHWLIQTHWIAIRRPIFSRIKAFFDNYSFCKENVLSQWWQINSTNTKVNTFYCRKKTSTNEEYSKRWVYSLMNFERGLSNKLITEGYELPCIYEESWPNEKLIKAHQNKSDTPLVSIVMTLYNIRRDFLEEAINSLLQQSYKNIEIICIDDCSPDVHYDDIEKISPKIRLVKNERNLGLCLSANKGFRLAQGRYIMRMGSDDILDPDYISKALNILENNSDIISVNCNLKRFGFATDIIERPFEWNLEDVLINKNVAGYGYAGGAIFRSNVLSSIKIDEHFHVCEDFDFHLSLLERGKIVSIHEPLYFYRNHETNIMKSIKKRERWDIINKIIEKHRKINNMSHVK